MEVLRKVLDSFPERASAVKIVVKQQNEGLPAARRSGLELATGKYVAHCDSDDWMEPNMLERMYLEAEAYDADAVVCAMFKDDDPTPTKYIHFGENCRDYIFSDMIAVGEMQSLCRYLIKREIYLQGVQFPRFNQGEDQTLLVQLAHYCKSIYCVKEPLYHWRTVLASITNAPSSLAVERRFKGASSNARLVESFLAGKGEAERYAPELTALKLYCMFYLRPLLRKGESIDKWRKEFPEIKGKVLSNKHIKFAHKLEYLVDMYCPPAMVKAVYRWRSHSR
jgi:glycosyltransferase involved in cell wall biosynthesis